MSLKSEKLNALKRTREFMRDMLDPKKTPRVPKVIRKAAYWNLRHWPWEQDVLIRDDDGKFRVPSRSNKKHKPISRS